MVYLSSTSPKTYIDMCHTYILKSLFKPILRMAAILDLWFRLLRGNRWSKSNKNLFSRLVISIRSKDKDFNWKLKNLTFELKLAYTYPLKASGGTHRKVPPTFFFIPLWSGDPMATYIPKGKQSVTNTPPY